MSPPTGSQLTYLSADRVITGSQQQVFAPGAVVVASGRVRAVGREEDVPIPEGAMVERHPGCSILPGFIDAHCHITLAGDSRTYEQMALDRDETMALVAVRNLQLHLRSGVTTVRDNGGRNMVSFAVRDAVDRGYLLSPRLLLAGRPVTPSAGHFHWCGGAADGADAIRAAVRRLVAEGADHIKIMASGGGTAGNVPFYASYDAEELRVAVQTAHQLGRLTTAHCRAKTSIANALEAGLDCIEHAEFLVPTSTERFTEFGTFGGRWEYDDELGRRIAASGTFVSFTLQPGYDAVADLAELQRTRELTAQEQQLLAMRTAYFAQKLDVFSSLLETDDEFLVISSDAGPFDVRFGRFHLVLETAVAGGMSALQAIEAATRKAAVACGVAREVGTLEPGKLADACVVRGDPLTDIACTSEVAAVYLGGDRVNTLLDTVAAAPAAEQPPAAPRLRPQPQSELNHRGST